MGLLRRLVRCFSADLHELLDTLEDPAAVCRQALREMEEVVEGMVSELRDLATRREEVMVRRAALESKREECVSRLRLSIEHDPPLARTVMRRKLQFERMLEEIVRQQGTLDREIEQGTMRVAEYRARMSELRERLECVEGQKRIIPERSDDTTITEEEITLALLEFTRSTEAPR